MEVSWASGAGSFQESSEVLGGWKERGLSTRTQVSLFLISVVRAILEVAVHGCLRGWKTVPSGGFVCFFFSDFIDEEDWRVYEGARQGK